MRRMGWSCAEFTKETNMMTTRFLAISILCLMSIVCVHGEDFSSLATLQPGKVQADNALWTETPRERQFISCKQIVLADLKGPGLITMIHFALPQKCIAGAK